LKRSSARIYASPASGELDGVLVPVAGLSGGFVEATRDLAINVRVLTPSGSAKGAAEVLVSSTVVLAGARVSLKVGEEVRRTFNAVSFQPLVTQRFTAPLENAEAAKNDLGVEITATDGKPLLHWSAADPLMAEVISSRRPESMRRRVFLTTSLERRAVSRGADR